MPMNIRTIASLTITMPELKLADSLMPITRMMVTAMMARKATRLNKPVWVGSVCGSMC